MLKLTLHLEHLKRKGVGCISPIQNVILALQLPHSIVSPCFLRSFRATGAKAILHLVVILAKQTPPENTLAPRASMP